MNKQLFVLDTKCQLSFDDMIDKVENIDNRIVYYYNKNYIIGKTVQYEIFDGIWLVYHDLVLKNPDLYPLEVEGFIQLNYCVSGRCELHYKNNKVFYVGAGDFIIGLLKNKQYKHSYPLGSYSGISIITTEEKLDAFIQRVFPETKLVSKKILTKMEENLGYILLSNNFEVKNIFDEMLLFNSDYWKEKAIIKFAELILLLFHNDMDLQTNRKYYDRQIINLVKQIKQAVTSDIEIYIKIEDISQKYHISEKTFTECFKEIYGKTYYSFIKEFRIKKAAELLRLEKNSVAEIALMVGYQNASKFSKAFLDVMGATPIHYRKNNSSTVLD